MGEFDNTEAIESVQTALSFFGQRNNSPTSIEELEKEKELRNIAEDLANVKVQLEAKDSAYKQALIRLHHHQKVSDDLSVLLRSSDFLKDFYINESRESNARINELESAMKQMAHNLSETGKAKDKSENALIEEKLTVEALMSRISGMNETIVDLKRKVLETEKEKAEAVSGKEAAVKAEAEARQQLEIMQDLENQLLNKSAHIVSLQMELKKAKELHKHSEKAASDAISEVKRLKENTKLQERELKELRGLNEILEKTRSELDASRERENDAQVEIALLKFELHKAVSRRSASNGKSENKNENTNMHENEREMENMKKELRTAMTKIGELRTRAEQAISRAEAAEKALAKLEDKMKRSKDDNKSVEFIDTNNSLKYDKTAKSVDHMPLSKVLDLKF